MNDMASWDETDWIAAIAAICLIAVLVVGGAIASRKSEEFAGHPRGLYVLFYAEMWERFSYYGMRALLIFYLTKHWLFSDGSANLIYGAYTSLVYIMPLFAGYLSDNWLGQRKAVVFGGVLLSIGHLLMVVEGNGGQGDPAMNVFWLALAFIIVGVGFLKANISVIVGQLYGLTDVRRDGAYTIFYMGINVGAALGGILVGYLGERIGWGYGFGLAGIGMVAGLIMFVLGKPALLGKGEPPAPLTQQREWSLYALGVAAVVATWFLIQYQNVVGSLLLVSGAALFAYVIYEAFKLERDARDRLFAIIFLLLLQPLFWGLFEQAGGSLNLFTDRLCRPAGRPRLVLPVGQSDLYRAARSAVRLAVDLAWQARAGTIDAGQVRPGAGPGRFRQSRAGLGGAECRHGRRRAGAVHFPDLPVPDHRRTLPVAGGAFGDEPAGAKANGQPDHGRLVLCDCGRQFRRRQDRRGDRRRKRRNDQGSDAGDLHADRLA